MFTQNWQALPVYAKKPLARTGYSGRALPRRQRSHDHAAPAPGGLPPRQALQDRGPRRRGGLFAASSTTLLVTDSFLGILMAFARFFTLAETTVGVAGHLWPRRTSPLPRDAAPTSPSSGAASASAMAQAP